MKKKLYICFLTVLLLLVGYLLCRPEPEYETISLQTRMEATYYQTEDDTVTDTILELREYDKNGNCIVIWQYHNGQLGFLDYYSYDRRGNETHKTTICINKWRPEILSREKKAYDENGNLTLHVEYDTWKEKQRIVYSYDESGNLIRKETRKPTGKVTTEVYLYDEKGNLIAEGEEESFGINYSTLHFYDEAGNQVRSEIYYSSVLNQHYENVFDSQGRMTYSVLYGENGEVRKFWEYTYNDEESTITLNCFDMAFFVIYMDDQDRVIRRDFYNAEWELTNSDCYFYEDIKIRKK